MSTKMFWSRFIHTAVLPLRLMIVVSMLISALMLPLGTVSAVSSNRVMCESDGSLVGCWRMEEGSGTSLLDGGLIPVNNDGTTTGSPSFSTGKIGNYAIQLNGTSQYAIVPDESSLDITSAITLSAWVKPEQATTQPILKKTVGSTTTNGYELSLASSGKVFIRFNGALANRVDSTTSYPTTGSTWMHIAGTYDGTTLRIYINGIQEATKATSAAIVANSTNLGIGVDPGFAPANYYKGAIDDARIYNRALTAPEIAALASTTPPGDITPPAKPTGLAAVPGDKTVALTWDALALPHDVKGWNVYRSTTTPVDTGTSLVYVTTESYTDNDPELDNGTLYYYTVKAVDTSNNASDPADEASATPHPTCYALTLNSGANGSAPTADPTQSIDCPAGEYKASEAITLTAHPDSGYEVDTWTGTNNDTLKTLVNTLTMPASIHTVTVTYTPVVNDAPVVTDIPNQTIAEGASFSAISLDDYVSDVDNTDEEMIWTYIGESELTVSIVDRVATITIPDAEWSGAETITFTATDPGLLYDEDAATFTVTALDDPPEVTNPGSQSNAEGDVISLQVTATDGDSPALAYSALNLPQGLSIDPDSGLISGTITFHAAVNSPYSASVTVTDETTPVTVNFTWTVSQTAFGACVGETGLVGCWQMEENGGAVIYDGSPAGNDGTTAGGPTWVTGKTDDYALSLSGTAQSASVPDDDSLDLTDAFTIAGWIKPGKSAAQDLFKKADMGLTDGYELGLATSTKVLFRLNQDTNADLYRINSTTLYPIDGITWMHVAATYSDGTMKLYINGVQEGGDLAAPAPAVNTLPFTLGTQVTAPRYYQGAMDDVRLYDRALSSDEIRLLAGLNIAPVVTDIPDQTIEEGTSFTTVSLDDYVSDLNNSDAEMDWTYSGNTALTVNIVDRVATITTPDADWNGSEAITFTATDPGFLYDEDAATFEVTGVNDAPVVTDIPDQGIAEGTSFTTINLDDYVSDVDNTDAELVWSYSGDIDLSVDIDEGTHVATITIPDADWYGSETITFKATDPDELWDDDPATFTVNNENDVPVVSDIPGETVAEGASFTTIDLDDFVSDIDNTDAEMVWSYSGDIDLSVDIDDGTHVATITTPDADWYGSETITFTATDPGFLFDEDDATFEVTGVNDAPIVTDIPDQGIAEGTSFTTINLDDYVSDVDNTDAELVWSYSGDIDLSVDIDEGTHVATITIPDADWYGSETITFKATDPDELWDDDPATFTVNNENDVPVVSDIPGETVAEGASFTTIDLDDFVSDIDNTDAEMVWSYSGDIDLSLYIDEVTHVATITTPDADWNGSEVITFKATDLGFLFDEDSATFTVNAVNDAPLVTDIPDQIIAEGASFTTINLDDYVSDVDNTDVEMIWSYSGDIDLTVSIVDRVATITTPGSDWNGSESITFKATDPGLLFDEDTATFTVPGQNDAPLLNPIGPRSTAELVPLLFTATATDIDLPPDPLTYSLTDGTAGSVPEGADIVLTSGDFSWTPTEAQGPEIYTFDVCVSDGFLSDCETITITVSEVATDPIGVADAYEVLETGIFDVPAPGVLENDSDADIPTDTLTAILDTTTAHGTLTLYEDGSFTYEPYALWSGIDTFTYRVYDGSNYSEIVSVTITVKLMKYYMPMILN